MKNSFQNWFEDLIEHRANPSADPVVIDVGPLPVRGSEVLNAFRALPAAKQAEIVRSKYRGGFLDAFIAPRIWRIAAQNKDVERDPLFRRQLERAKDNLIVGLYLERYGGDSLAVSAAEIEAYYKAHPEKYSPKTEIRACRILVSSQAEANRVQKLAKAMAFDELASRISLDPVDQRGVALAYPAEDKMGIGQVLQAMKIGEISRGYQVEERYAVYKKVGHINWPAANLEWIRGKIRMIIIQEKQARLRQKVQATIPIKVHTDVLDALLLRALPSPPMTQHAAPLPVTVPASTSTTTAKSKAK